MKQTVRNATFETNSSSIHSLAISKFLLLDQQVNYKTLELTIRPNGEFGWGWRVVTTPEEKLKYLYAFALYAGKDGKSNSYLDKLKKKFPKCWFVEPNPNAKYYDCYIDHCSEKISIIEYAFAHLDEFMNNGAILVYDDNNDYDHLIDKYLHQNTAVIVASGGN